ncbi:MAG: hypothetical protein KDJ63_09250 [Nitratireductor sp.]|nr:hypothetical protein [Nitratireductor sp.]
MKKLLATVIIFALIAVVVWIAGIRIIVIQPIGAIPKGVTVVVANLPKLRLIDSPDAMCYRQMGGVSLLCRGAMAAAIANNGKILLRLPYSETLFRMTGGPYRYD